MSSGRTRVGLVENVGPNNLRDELRGALSTATEADILVAFATEKGVRSVLPVLGKVAIRGHVRIVTGLYQCVTEPGALRLLFEQAERYGDRFQVRLSKDRRLHRKLYVSRTRAKATVFIGSSNLTEDGLTSGGELNLGISGPVDDRSLQLVLDLFEAEWRRRSLPLTARMISLYSRYRPERPFAALAQTRLTEILGATEQRRKAVKSESRPSQCFRMPLTHYFGDETELVVGGETGWDRRGLEYTTPPPKVQPNDRILFFDFTGRKRAYLAVVVDTARTITRTADGRDFFAYRILSRRKWSSRLLTPGLKRRLRDAGLPGAEARLRDVGSVSAERWPDVERLFRR